MTDLNKLISQLEAKKKQLADLRDRVLPVKAGNMVVNFFKDNFRKGGYQDGSLQRWPVTRRQQDGIGASAQYGPLLSKRLHLMRTTRYTVQPGKTTILNDLIYARIHNHGGTLTHNVTGKMRKFAWAKFFEADGGGKKDEELNEKARFWKSLALTRKTQIRQVIPKRQFMGKPVELIDKVNDLAESEIRKILNS